MVPRPQNGLSLCAGAGALDMGLMLAEPGFHTRCFVEWERYPRQALIAAQRAGYFAPAPIWDDLTTFDAKPLRGAIDTVLAGYPCQPFSAAGQRKGADDPRHLWPHVARVIDECRPIWVFLENVGGHVSLGLDTVLRDLWGMDYTPAAGLFTAAETGAPHQRERVFIVAYCAGELEHSPRIGRGEGRPEPEVRSGRGSAGIAGDDLADTGGAGPQGREQPGASDERDRTSAHGPVAERGRLPLFPPGPGDAVAWASVMRMAPDLAPALSLGDVKRLADHCAQMVARGKLAEAEAQSRVCLAAHGLAHRARALRLLGNGVCPIQAAYAWRTLTAAHGLQPIESEDDA